MARGTRWVLLLSCVGGLAFALQVYSTSPARVPIHYGPGGVPDRWGSPLDVLLIHGCVIGFGTALFLALPKLIRHAPKSLINLPHKDYWLAPEHRDAATAKFAPWSYVVGTAVNVLMITLQAVLSPTTDAALPSSAAPALVTLGFVFFTLGSCVWLARSFKRPERDA